MISARDDETGRDRATPRARLAAEEMIAAWMAARFERPLDRIVQAEFRSRGFLNSGERRWVSEAVYGTARYWRRQLWILRVRGRQVTAENLVQQWHEGPHEAGSSDFVSAFDLPGPESPAAFLRETLAFPDELAAEMEALLGDEAVRAGEAFNRQAPITLRVNTLRATRMQVLAKLPLASATRFSPIGVELPSRVNIRELPGFKEGWLELQEEASQLTAILCDAKPGDTVIDVGAGSGGKSLALAAMMQKQGRLFALDRSAQRLAELKKRSERAGARNIHPIELETDDTGRWQLCDATMRKIDNLKKSAHCVLLDAPCTGSGVLRRSPDIKWRRNDIAAYSRLQSVLLEQSSAFVAPQGVLVYVTCALERSQNEDIIEGFLQSNAGKEFEILPALPRLRAAVNRIDSLAGNSNKMRFANEETLANLFSGAFLRTWPHKQNMDGFFAACLVRV